MWMHVDACGYQRPSTAEPEAEDARISRRCVEDRGGARWCQECPLHFVLRTKKRARTGCGSLRMLVHVCACLACLCMLVHDCPYKFNHVHTSSLMFIHVIHVQPMPPQSTQRHAMPRQLTPCHCHAMPCHAHPRPYLHSHPLTSFMLLSSAVLMRPCKAFALHAIPGNSELAICIRLQLHIPRRPWRWPHHPASRNRPCITIAFSYTPLFCCPWPEHAGTP